MAVSWAYVHIITWHFLRKTTELQICTEFFGNFIQTTFCFRCESKLEKIPKFSAQTLNCTKPKMIAVFQTANLRSDSSQWRQFRVWKRRKSQWQQLKTGFGQWMCICVDLFNSSNYYDTRRGSMKRTLMHRMQTFNEISSIRLGNGHKEKNFTNKPF